MLSQDREIEKETDRPREAYAALHLYLKSGMPPEVGFLTRKAGRSSPTPELKIQNGGTLPEYKESCNVTLFIKLLSVSVSFKSVTQHCSSFILIRGFDALYSM